MQSKVLMARASDHCSIEKLKSGMGTGILGGVHRTGYDL